MWVSALPQGLICDALLNAHRIAPAPFRYTVVINPAPSVYSQSISTDFNLGKYISHNEKGSRILSQSKLSVGIVTLIADQDFRFQFLGLRCVSKGARNNCYEEGGKDEE